MRWRFRTQFVFEGRSLLPCVHETSRAVSSAVGTLNLKLQTLSSFEASWKNLVTPVTMEKSVSGVSFGLHRRDKSVIFDILVQ